MHFISGLPRSGSTLLSCILSQNPKLHASMTSPVAQIVKNCIKDLSNMNEANVFMSDKQRKDIIKGIFRGYYKDIFPKIVFDTNRFWCSQTHLLKELYPECKIICCVRSLAWICDSLERLLRKYPFEVSKISGFNTDANIYDRVELWTKGDGIIGYPLNAFKQALSSTERDRLFLLDYDTFVSMPEITLNSLYSFLGLPNFEHHYDNITYDVKFNEFDERLGAKGLHSVGSEVKYEPRDTILPVDIFNRLTQESFWIQ